MNYNKFDEFYFLSYAEQKAAMKVYKRLKINRFELVMLAGIAAYLQVTGKRVAGRSVMFQWFGYPYGVKMKSIGYLEGLKRKGCIHSLNYKRQPHQDGKSFVITPFGGYVLDCYYAEVEKIDQANKDRKTKPGIKDKIIPSDKLSELLPNYYLFSAGRDQ